MRKIRLSDTDLELFDMEVSPAEFSYFQKHKDAFRCMWKDQGKPFWTRFTITFRSFTVKHGVIKQMNCDSPKFENLLDQGFIYIHEKFIDGKEGSARIFIEDIARLAQNHDKFSNLDSKTFSKDPFYSRETRDLFRRFFGQPDQRASYLKVYVLSPIYLRFGGSICRCLKKWMDAEVMDKNDESYWVPPAQVSSIQESKCTRALMCTKCLDDCGTKYFREKICGGPDGPKFLEYWRLGDPRLNDNKNPLFCPGADRNSDWRDNLLVEDFRDFLHYAKFKYGTEDDKCKECLSIGNNRDALLHLKCGPECQAEKKKKKKKKKKRKDDDNEERTLHAEINKITHHVSTTTIVESFSKEVTPGDGSRNTGDNKEKITKAVFSSKAKVTDDFKYGIMSGNKDENKRKVVGGFKVVKIEDDKTKAFEMTLTVAALKGEDDETRPRIYDEVKTANIAQPLSVEHIHKGIKNLPEMMEWWEAQGWCACVLNYEVEEKHNPTNFTIKVSGPDEEAVKRTMFKLLFYVSKRKNRPCPGWTMNDDDIVACILPDDSPDQEGLSISIMKGFRFEDRLSEEERKTLKPQVESSTPLKKVLMTLDGKDCAAMLQEGTINGKVNLRNLLHQISNGTINEDINEEYIAFEDGSVLRTGKGEPPIIDVSRCGQPGISTAKDIKTGLNLTEEPIWEQMQKNPDNFDLFVMVDKDKEEEMKEHGLRTVNMKYIRELEGNEECDICKKKNVDCKCKDGFKLPMPKTPIDFKSMAQNVKEILVPNPEAVEFCMDEKNSSDSDLDDGKTPTSVSKTSAESKTRPPELPKSKTDTEPAEKSKTSTNDTSRSQSVKEVTGASDLLSTSEKKENSTDCKADGKKKQKAKAKQQTDGKQTEVPQKDGVRTDKTKVKMENHVVEEDKEKSPRGDKSVEELKTAENGSNNLRKCANCGQVEPSPKAFKKCQKCKLESIINARYYCGRDCQVADWTNKHKKEHKEKLLH